MRVNYFNLNVGDFYAFVQGLDLEGQGIAISLISRMMSTEKPIKTQWVSLGFPKDAQEKARLILEGLFEETPDGWIAEPYWSQLQDYQRKCVRNQENGKKGGRPKKANVSHEEPIKTQSVSVGFLDETDVEPKQKATSNEELITNKDSSTTSSAAEKKRSPLLPIPLDPDPEWVTAAREIRPDVDPMFVWRKMKDYYRSEKKAISTWRRIMMTWVGREHGQIRQTAYRNQNAVMMEMTDDDVPDFDPRTDR